METNEKNLSKKQAESFDSIPGWIEWKHISRGKTHCEPCLKMDKCWFVINNMPKQPQHPYCHCTSESLKKEEVLNKVIAKSRYSKFDPYLFDPQNAYKHGKGELFEKWGYNVEDSLLLKTEIEKQAREKYLLGDYKLGYLNEQGQRISIRIQITKKNNSEKVSFITGWLVHPNGTIQLATPYGGK